LGLLSATANAGTDNGRTELDTSNYLVGTWNCAHTFGDDSGTYTTTYEKVFGGVWLKQTYSFAATRTEPAMQAEYFVGYDGNAKQWVRFGIMSDAMYFAMVGKRNDNTWSWGYVLPVQTKSGAVIYTKQSDTHYTIDGPTYPRNGVVITEHHDCTKA